MAYQKCRAFNPLSHALALADVLESTVIKHDTQHALPQLSAVEQGRAELRP